MVIVSFVVLFRNQCLRGRLLAIKMLTCNCFENFCKSPPRRGKNFRFLIYFMIFCYNCSAIHISNFKLSKMICLNLNFSWSSATKNKVWYLEDTQIMIGTTGSYVCSFIRIWGNKHCGKNWDFVYSFYFIIFFCFVVLFYNDCFLHSPYEPPM